MGQMCPGLTRLRFLYHCRRGDDAASMPDTGFSRLYDVNVKLSMNLKVLLTIGRPPSDQRTACRAGLRRGVNPGLRNGLGFCRIAVVSACFKTTGNSGSTTSRASPRASDSRHRQGGSEPKTGRDAGRGGEDLASADRNRQKAGFLRPCLFSLFVARGGPRTGLRTQSEPTCSRSWACVGSSSRLLGLTFFRFCPF